MEESFIVISFVVSEKKRAMPKYRKNTPCEIGLKNFQMCAIVIKALTPLDQTFRQKGIRLYTNDYPSLLSFRVASA